MIIILLSIAKYYLLGGAIFGVAFFFRGHAAIAPEASGAPSLVRLIWIPAAIALWPLLAWKWYKAKRR